ncbi:uracil-DNA glycosylase [Sphingomonas lutea]|uniref:Uracil-DNA glycosylase n=1 Tax=Sphingomonas lutea TaxID=1045317 RepID=A0A7G9SFJ1_9SPHN|nr:uracil-DNA glycosylase family protein [Sphingomonas lutea]QNN66616.1 uracil-DNA glycosylase [Sphingomonas lutea]
MGGNLETMEFGEARSALAWWLEAGVDTAVQDAPRNWLAPAKPAPAVAPSPEPVSNLAEPTSETLAELQQWLSSSVQLPLASATARRILPHGPEQAPVMLLSDSPALEDFTSGQPIGGVAWALALRMLAAIGLSGEQAYSASLSCFHSPGTRMTEAERKACADIARRHIALVKPQRLLLLGDGPCAAMLDKRLVQARGHVHKIEGVRTVATFHPRHLVNRPLDKALAWRDLLLLMEDES